MNTDKEKITEVVQAYFLGTYHNNVEQLKQAFHEDAHITGIFKGNYVDWTRSEFIARMTGDISSAEKNEPLDKVILSFDQAGDAAIVKARVVVGGNVFIDYITLLKINGQWIIRNKSFVT